MTNKNMEKSEIWIALLRLVGEAGAFDMLDETSMDPEDLRAQVVAAKETGKQIHVGLKHIQSLISKT